MKKTITIQVSETGQVSSDFKGLYIYEAIGAVQLTLDLLRDTARRENNMYVGEKPQPGETKPPQLNNN